jgi:hypothetical protein
MGVRDGRDAGMRDQISPVGFRRGVLIFRDRLKNSRTNFALLTGNPGEVDALKSHSDSLDGLILWTCLNSLHYGEKTVTESVTLMIPH